jgi:DNA adenine methylase
MKPILKWAGSKQQLLNELKKYITSELLEGHRYIEPFIGGGALAFDLEHEHTVIGDLNVELTNMYNVIRDDPNELIKLLKQHQQMACCADTAEDWYYEVRAWDREADWHNRSSEEHAARMIYLNKTCFNGLYRVNSKGYFNTPIGRTTTGKVPDIVQEEAILEMSEFLKKHCDVRTGDYRYIIQDAQPMPGDVIYLDPPYDSGEEIKAAGFVGYQKEGWTRRDLETLKSECDYWSRLGAKIVVSNNDTQFVRELFSDWEIHSVDVRRSINRNGDNRKGKEVIITNY